VRPVRAEGRTGLNAEASVSLSGSLRAAVSAAFATEHGAILGYYAARIEAAKRGATPAAIIAAIRAILDEQTVALRNLANRRHVAEKAEQDQQPGRPETPNTTAAGGGHAL
jgi:hypothetical protein